MQMPLVNCLKLNLSYWIIIDVCDSVSKSCQTNEEFQFGINLTIHLRMIQKCRFRVLAILTNIQSRDYIQQISGQGFKFSCVLTDSYLWLSMKFDSEISDVENEIVSPALILLEKMLWKNGFCLWFMTHIRVFYRKFSFIAAFQFQFCLSRFSMPLAFHRLSRE